MTPHPDVSPSEDDVSVRRFVHGLNIIVAAAVALSGLGVLLAPVHSSERIIIMLIGFATVIGSEWQLRKSPKNAVLVMASGFWILTALNAVFLAGIHSSANVVFPFVIALVGWALGTTWLVVATVATVAFMAVLALLEYLEWFIPTQRAPVISVVTTYMSLLPVMAYLTYSAKKQLSGSRDRAQQVSNALAAQNAELERSREETDRLMKNMPAAVASFDAHSHLLRCNQRYADLFAAKPQEIIGKHIREYVPQVAIDQLETQWKEALAGKPQSYRRFNVDPQSHLVTWVDAALMPILEGSQVVGLDAVLMDVTDKVQAEAELKSLNIDLEQKVEKRTRALLAARERLEESHDDLLRAQAAGSLVAMIAGVSHELGTPVGNSRLAASSSQDLLRDVASKFESGRMTKTDLATGIGALQEGFRILESNLTRAESLLQSFRQVSADQASEQRRSFDLAETVAEVVGSMTPMLRRKPHRLLVEVPPGIVMDSLPGPLGQVLINLINNAYLHAFEGVAQGTLTLHAELREGGEVRIRVEDDGCGMEPEVLHRLFDPFFSTRIGSGGTGLGMGIVKRIVQRMLGGQITVDSEPGKGTRFTIALPQCAPRAQ